MSLFVGLVYLLRVNRDQWFFGDEWDFLGYSRDAQGVLDGYLQPHNEHWSTAPLLVYRVLRGTVGLHSYVPYVLVLVLLHLTLAHLLWRVVLRMNVDASIATALVTVFIFLGAGSENLLWAFQIGFVGSVTLGMGAVLLVDHGGAWARRDTFALGGLIVGLMFSGLSLVMVAVAGIVVLLRRGLRQAVFLVAPPAVVFLAWYARFHATNEFAASGPGDALRGIYPYVVTGLTTSIERTLGLPGSGALLVLVLIVVLIRKVDLARTTAAPAFACALGALLMFITTGLGRLQLGIEQAEASRYTYVTVALLLPATGMGLAWLAGSRREAIGVVVVGLTAVAVYNVGLLRAAAASEAVREGELKGIILASADLASRGDGLIPGALPEPTFSPNITVDDLLRWKRDGMLPKTDHSKASTLGAETDLRLALATARLPNAATLERRCRTILPGASLVLAPAGRELSRLLVSRGASTVRVAFVDLSTGVEGRSRTLPWPGGTGYLSTTSSAASLSIGVVDGAPVVICTA